MAKPLPVYRPMLATRVELDDVRAGWFSEWVEMKWDGYRCLAYIENGRTQLRSRNGKDISASFPELLDLHRQFDARRAVLDGEIVAFGEDGRPSFALLATRLPHAAASVARATARPPHAATRLALPRPRGRSLAAATRSFGFSGDNIRAGSAATPAVYIVFDLLHWDDGSLVRLPLYQRRQVLEGVLTAGDRVQLSETVTGFVPDIFRAVEKMNMEGIVVKDPDSPYFPGRRSPSWKKIKCRRTMLARVVGYTARAGTVRALLVATEEGRTASTADSTTGSTMASLHYAGRVGSGFSEKERRELFALLQPLARPRPPIDPVPEDVPAGAVWIEPQPVCRVAYLEFSPYGRLRHPSFAGWEQPPRTALAARS